MKKISNIWLLAALVCGLSLSVTSCKDDDDDDNGGNGTEQETSATETDEAKAAYTWLVNLTDIDDFTDDWASKTYEPTIGVESKNQANTRIVVVADIDHARMNFASISGMGVDELSTVQSQTIDGVGTLTWTPSAAGASNLATVDVNTKLIPHLSRIVYCTVDQVGDNGGYEGTAYYRFGDVIEDTEGYFWVCVKPAFGTGSAPQQQGYWINILNRDPDNGKSRKGTVPPIPTDNIKDYNKNGKDYNGNTIKLPTKLNSTKEHVHNLSNLVWALLDPDSYEKAVGTKGIGLGGYDYKYNGANFCRRVADQWKDKGIWEKLFNRSYAQMKQMRKLNFFYNGYHWVWGTTAGVWIAKSTDYESVFTSSIKADDTLFEMTEKGAGFDIRRYCSDPDQDEDCASTGKAGYAPEEQFTGTEGYWVVRQKTSSEIAGTSKLSHPSVYATLNNTAEVYRYNQAYQKVVGSESPVEQEDDLDLRVTNAPAEGEAGTYMIGDVVKDDLGCKWFCINGSAYNKNLYPTVTDKSAWFITFDNINCNEYKATNLIEEEDLPEVSLRLIEFLEALILAPSPYNLNLQRDTLGYIAQHIKTYAGVDLRQLVNNVDSVWKFYSNSANKTLASTSTSYLTSMAYEDNTNQQAIARLVFDHTQSGTERNGCVAKSGTRYNNTRFLVYKNYEKYDPDNMTLTDDEVSLQMNKWQTLWPVSNKKMYLQDVSNQDVVREFCEHNKWYALTSPRANEAKPADYLWDSKAGLFANSGKLSLLMDRILFFRVMKVTDNGGTMPNLTSQDGRKLTIVHLQNDKMLYRQNFQSFWTFGYVTQRDKLYYLNNKQYTVKPIAGYKD